MKKTFVGGLLAALALWTLPAAAQTQTTNWPTKPVRVIVPLPAGGQSDAVVRYYMQKLETSLGQPFIVENKPGVNTMLGTQEVARAPADGYTILYNMTAIVSNPVLLTGVKYDPFKDFVPIHRTYELFAVFAVPGSSPNKTLASFVSAAKASREPVSYGTTGHASSSHYFVELLAKQAGLNMTHIPYKGESPLFPDLISGRLQAAIVSGAAVKQFEDGRLQPLAVSGTHRLSLLPNIPTFKELGYQGIGNESFAGFFAPTGTPPAIVEKLNRELTRISELPETRERLAALALEPSPAMTPAAFLALMRRAHDEWVSNRGAVDIKPQ
ncbi:tripartite tricarboxylate transporter substrate binding protein [Piscinibacter sakaiensis]|uniref:Putative exported protein n=1 Tax=Piscinibacter sakaiensis TaxID=1547922 RepID=A0A0K8P3F8_PISS1|nr:tripartite tricarboxylate transporter substrate binding protein [Piscinibacter sakaiensis]GAP37146.1 putative exported protein [Piscinibacter sakaiensis]